MQDLPTTTELSDAVREFLEIEILPNLTDARLKFRVLVAMNALGMISREANLEEAHLDTEFSSLKTLLGFDAAIPESFSSLKALTLQMNTTFSSQIRAGQLPEGTFNHLERVTRAKLAISNPGYLKRYAE
jgi:hypothetical protein